MAPIIAAALALITAVVLVAYLDDTKRGWLSRVAMAPLYAPVLVLVGAWIAYSWIPLLPKPESMRIEVGLRRAIRKLRRETLPVHSSYNRSTAVYLVTSRADETATMQGKASDIRATVAQELTKAGVSQELVEQLSIAFTSQDIVSKYGDPYGYEREH